MSNSIDFPSAESTVQDHELEISTATSALPYSVEPSEEDRVKDTNQVIDLHTNSTVTEVNAGYDSDLILCPDQLTLLDSLRRTLRSYEIDADRFQVCVEWRDHALSKHTRHRFIELEFAG